VHELNFHLILSYIQQSISFAGVLVILSGVLLALYRYFIFFALSQNNQRKMDINTIRLSLSRIFLLGLEFIVGADLIGTTTAPDYYSIGIVACIVLIRTVLSYTLSKEVVSLTEESVEQARVPQ
jgi:uncharacterized membrane protein